MMTTTSGRAECPSRSSSRNGGGARRSGAGASATAGSLASSTGVCRGCAGCCVFDTSSAAARSALARAARSASGWVIRASRSPPRFAGEVRAGLVAARARVRVAYFAGFDPVVDILAESVAVDVPGFGARDAGVAGERSPGAERFDAHAPRSQIRRTVGLALGRPAALQAANGARTPRPGVTRMGDWLLAWSSLDPTCAATHAGAGGWIDEGQDEHQGGTGLQQNRLHQAPQRRLSRHSAPSAALPSHLAPKSPQPRSLGDHGRGDRIARGAPPFFRGADPHDRS